MTKEKIIRIVASLGFSLSYDQWDEKGWMQFVLSEDLDEPDLRLIWYRKDTDSNNFTRAGKILFSAGRKSKVLELQKYL